VSPALANDGASSFVVFLVVLLAMMLVAVIRMPEWDGSSQQDAGPRPATAAPADAQARATATIARAAAVLPVRPPRGWPEDNGRMPRPAVAASQVGQVGYAARHVAGPAPGEGTILRPRVSSGPPWGPAPKPPDIK
jgi:hypothetical protein